ncbi:MAG TPA: family 78 glycoside hydrolase catalytic domain, partial [Acidimicrobiales bacterium]|nr:family 78 glycoside hydrolase catalytic domain [Acidimicrobiales bacterium]
MSDVVWSAAMISPVDDLCGAPVLRTTIALDRDDVASAVLHASALGVFEASVDGVPVSDDVLSPGWSSYEWRLRYRTCDVSSMVRDGALLSFALGNGWYRGRLGWAGKHALYGDRLGVIAQLEVTYADGSRQVVVSDETWTASPSVTMANDLYDGQTIDAGRDRSAVVPVEVLPFDTAVLAPYVGPPVRRHESVPPVRTWMSPSGRHLVDFGQNLVGWVRLRAHGPAGAVVTVRHA